MARRAGDTDRRRTRARGRRLRVPDAPRRPGAARRPARARRAPAADLRAVRTALVRVFAASPAGEPEDRRLHRRRHRWAVLARPLQRRLIWSRAEGCRVWDADGREYIDLSGGFGVAAL